MRAALDDPQAPAPPLDDYLAVYNVDNGIWWRLEWGPPPEALLAGALDLLEEHERPDAPKDDGPFEFRD